MKFLAIDPGVSGGIALIDADRCAFLVRGMPETEIEIITLLREAKLLCDDMPRGILEQVSGWQGGNKKGDGSDHKSQGAPGSAMFEFGRSYGMCSMALTAIGLHEGTGFDRVRPQTWQKHFNLPKMDYQKRKRYCRDLAQGMFPDVKVTLQTSDALLLAEYLRQRSL